MEGSEKTVTTLISLPIPEAELLKGIEFVHSIARSAPVPAGTHEEVRNILEFIAKGIQREQPSKVAPAEVPKKKESGKAKASVPVKEIPLGVGKKSGDAVKEK